MKADRINDFISIDREDVVVILSEFLSAPVITDITRMNEGMANTGYRVATTSGVFLLKLYSGTSDGIECAMYRLLRGKVNQPELYYHDDSRRRFPFAYTVTEFIDGVTLTRYIKSTGNYPIEFAREAGGLCGAIHGRRYPYDALLDRDLEIIRKLPFTREKILMMLDGKPAFHLKAATASALRGFIGDNPELFERISEESVLCHGDYSYGNLMLSGGKTYCIDYEFAYAGSRYHDIGHFFRRKDDFTQSLVDERIYAAFADGYGAAAGEALPADWLALARLCDVNAMLCLLNYNNVPDEWVADIETDILASIS